MTYLRFPPGQWWPEKYGVSNELCSSFSYYYNNYLHLGTYTRLWAVFLLILVFIIIHFKIIFIEFYQYIKLQNNIHSSVFSNHFIHTSSKWTFKNLTIRTVIYIYNAKLFVWINRFWIKLSVVLFSNYLLTFFIIFGNYSLHLKKLLNIL